MSASKSPAVRYTSKDSEEAAKRKSKQFFEGGKYEDGELFEQGLCGKLSHTVFMMSASAAARVEITVLSGGAAEPGLTYVAEAFHKETGHTVRIRYNMGERGRKLMDEGLAVDVVVATSHSIKRNFRPEGRVEEGGVSLGRVGLGMMVRAGAPVPDISSAAALRRAVLDADAVLNTEETSGLCIEDMLKTMDIFAQVEPKLIRHRNGPELMDRVLSGSCKEVAFLPITAILTYKEKGIVLAGALPDDAQTHLEMMAVPATMSNKKDIAWEFVRFCGGPGKPLLVANGLK